MSDAQMQSIRFVYEFLEHAPKNGGMTLSECMIVGSIREILNVQNEKTKKGIFDAEELDTSIRNALESLWKNLNIIVKKGGYDITDILELNRHIETAKTYFATKRFVDTAAGVGTGAK
jgi:hypothetical protein